MRLERGALLAWVVVVCYMALMFAISSKPYMPEPKVRGTDKLEHLVEYAVLGALVLWALKRSRVGSAVLGSMVISAAYGAVDEVHQIFVPGRSCSLTDWTADVAGAILGAVVLGMIFRDKKIN
jgi:VanZ family protein